MVLVGQLSIQKILWVFNLANVTNFQKLNVCEHFVFYSSLIYVVLTVVVNRL